MPHKRRKTLGKAESGNGANSYHSSDHGEEQNTDEKLAILSSVFEDRSPEELLDALLDHDGSVERALDAILTTATFSSNVSPTARKTTNNPGIQSSLNFISTRPSSANATTADAPSTSIPRPLTKKGKTLYLYDPPSIALHTPCTIIHNFLPPDLAISLLTELLPETTTFTSATFRLFDKTVKSPHTASFYVNSLSDAAAQKSYLYNGSTLDDVREILPVMRRVSALVETAVNAEIAKRIKTYPGGVKLRHQAPGPWIPNAAFVNCYDGPQQSVGFHTDQLSYLGPHPVIGSLSLGVQREFRIRRIVPPPDLEGLDLDSAEAKKLRAEYADAQGQIALPLPHNSLLVMHAEMQETWKHSIAPASSATGGITPHAVAGGKRINVTYRWYREEFAPENTPLCKCGAPCVLKSVMRRKTTLGKYVWMCQVGGRVDGEGVGAGEGKEDGVSGKREIEETENAKVLGGKGCGYFEWAEFDDDGVPMWLSEERRKDKAEEGIASASKLGTIEGNNDSSR